MVRMAPTMFPPLGRFVLSTRARVLGANRLVDSTLATTMADRSRIDPALRQRLVDMTERRASFPEATGAFVDSTRSLFWYLTRRMPGDLGRVTVPTLLVHGDKDRLVSVNASRALAKRRPDITLEVIEDCGHTPQLECPEHFVDLVGTWVAGAVPAR
jgi:pimeloyl-ACP methyl ester carboxylesterase